MNIELFKAHGLGNDYLVWAKGPAVTPELARSICHRHTGVGGDGILEPFTSDRADHGIRIWNPDGSVAEKSGNGLRIASWWLHHERGAPATHTVDTGFDVVHSVVDGDQVTVQMGRATFVPDAIPARVDGPVALADGTALEVVPVGTGNPHAVVFTDTFDLPWRAWGAELEVHDAFPNRTNVQFARVLGPHDVEIRIWERGAGETSASGSSSCGVAAAAVRTGRCQPGAITVHMPGGVLHVTVGEAYDLTLKGPVAPIASIRVV